MISSDVAAYKKLLITVFHCQFEEAIKKNLSRKSTQLLWTHSFGSGPIRATNAHHEAPKGDRPSYAQVAQHNYTISTTHGHTAEFKEDGREANRRVLAFLVSFSPKKMFFQNTCMQQFVACCTRSLNSMFLMAGWFRTR